jgi:NAD+ synthetase
MKVGVAQINTVVGDLEGNGDRILNAYRQAADQGADLVLFPELAITGYPPMDLLERRSFIDRNLDVLDRLVTRLTGPAAVVGFVERAEAGPGKPLFNAAAVVAGGRILDVHRKALLPTYDVFDEARYFEPSPMPTVVRIGGTPVAVTICEDIWNSLDAPGRYHDDPVAAAASLGARLLVNVSASPYEIGKPAARLSLARSIAVRHRLPVIYANLVGGNDGLIFDGGSFGVASDGTVIARGASFEPDLFVMDPAGPSQVPDDASNPAIRNDTADVIDALCLGLRDFCGKTGLRRVVVGLSGGIDSAVVAALAVRALGADAVTGITMPSCYSSEETRRGAAELAENLGITFVELPVSAPFDAFLRTVEGPMGGRPGGLTEENLQARIRGTLLMAWSNRFGGLVLNTGNKSELAVGYSTLYGDMVGGLAVIGDLTKDRVYAVARELNRTGAGIPDDTLTRPPSAELRPDQRDEDSLPPYSILDPIVRAFVEEGLDGAEIVSRGLPADAVDWVLRQLAATEFKRRQAPIALKVTPRAFGPGRRFPIVARYREGLR